MSLIKSTATIAGNTLLSRVLGYVRDMLTAHIVGANDMTDAFFVAFKLPNYFRRIFAEGAFNSAFVPLYSRTLAGEGAEEAQKFASDAMSALFGVLLVLTVFFIIIMPSVVWVLAPGFQDNPSKFALTISLTRITFPYLLFIALVSLLGGILNSVGKFGAVAATPIIMNLCFIVSLVFLVPFTPTPVHAMAVGVFVSGVAQYAWLHWFCKKAGVMPRLHRPTLTANVKKLLKLIAPAAIGSSVAQINLMIDTIIASNLPNNGVSYLYYGDRISELPLAVIGIAIGTALLPMLSRQIRAGDDSAALHSLNRGLELCLLLALPATLALLVIAEPVITVMFERGAFTPADTHATATALMAFAVGLPAFVLVKIFAPAFYAREDTKTPFKIAAMCVVLNLCLNLLLMGPLLHVGLALSTSIAAWVNVVCLATILHKRSHWRMDAALRLRGPRILLAGVGMTATVAAMNVWLAPYFHGHLLAQIIALSAIVLGGMAVYGGLCIATHAIDRAHIMRGS